MAEENILLPLWRGRDILVFMNLTDRDGRLGWAAVARSQDDGQSFNSLGRLAMSADSLAECAVQAVKIRTSLGTSVTLTNLDSLTNHLDTEQDLLLLCGYFNFLRKYAVETVQLQSYCDADPETRFSLSVGLALNKLMLDRFEPMLAAQILDQDFAQARAATGNLVERGEYFRSAARLYEMLELPEKAAAGMTIAAQLQPSDDKWRKAADYNFQTGNFDAAIDCFRAAEALAPLPLPAAFRLGKMLFEADRGEEARPYLEAAQELFSAPCTRMLAAISTAA